MSGEIRLRRSILGRCKTELPTDATVWINDATANQEELESLLGQPVHDRTPVGRLAREWPVLQISHDVTQRTTPQVAASILRGILYDLPYRHVGVITHKHLCGPIRRLLGSDFNSRIAMVWHFRGGQSRGSNDWIETCDALIVLGTPRVPPEAVRSHLLWLDKRRAASMTTKEAGWGLDWWSGRTESGRRVTIKTLHYADHDWHAAYQSLVVAELNQALGRAQANLEKRHPMLPGDDRGVRRDVG